MLGNTVIYQALYTKMVKNALYREIQIFVQMVDIIPALRRKSKNDTKSLDLKFSVVFLG